MTVLPLPPVILGFDGIYDENETVHVACTSSGSKPTATVMWFWNGIPVGDFEVVVIPEDDGTSVVTSYFRRRLSRAMNGTILTCAVTNSVMINLNLDSALTNVTLSISCKYQHSQRQANKVLFKNNLAYQEVRSGHPANRPYISFDCQCKNNSADLT